MIGRVFLIEEATKKASDLIFWWGIQPETTPNRDSFDHSPGL